jgi:uncharacterized protein (UPF0261 family)
VFDKRGSTVLSVTNPDANAWRTMMEGRRPPLAYVVGTFDTKGAELQYVSDLLQANGVATVRVDVGTRAHEWAVDVAARTVASHHPLGVAAVFEPTDRCARLLRPGMMSAE